MTPMATIEECAADDAERITDTGWRVLEWLADAPMSRREIHARRARECLDWDETVEAVDWFLSMCMIREEGRDYAMTDYGYAVLEARP